MSNVVATCACGHLIIVPAAAIGSLCVCDSCGQVLRVKKRNTKPVEETVGESAASKTDTQFVAHCEVCGTAFSVEAHRAASDQALVCDRCTTNPAGAPDLYQYERRAARVAAPSRVVFSVLTTYREALSLVLRHVYLIYYFIVVNILTAIVSIAAILFAPIGPTTEVISAKRIAFLFLYFFFAAFVVFSATVPVTIGFCRRILRILRGSNPRLGDIVPGFAATMNGWLAGFFGWLGLVLFVFAISAPILIGHFVPTVFAPIIFLAAIGGWAGVRLISESETSSTYIFLVLCFGALFLGGYISPLIPIGFWVALFIIGLSYIIILMNLMLIRIADGENALDALKPSRVHAAGYTFVWIRLMAVLFGCSVLIQAGLGFSAALIEIAVRDYSRWLASLWPSYPFGSGVERIMTWLFSGLTALISLLVATVNQVAWVGMYKRIWDDEVAISATVRVRR